MIHIFTGTNNYLLRAKLHEQIDDFIIKQGDMAVEKLDGEDASYERIQEALQSLPFLSDKKLVVLRTPSANKTFVDKVNNLLSELPDTTELIIYEPKLDKRSAYYKFLKKQNGYTEFNDLDENGLAKWLVSLAAENQADLSLTDARYLVDRVGSQQHQLAQEVEKLSLFQRNITHTTINQLTTANPRSTIFQMLEAAFAGNTKLALDLYAEQRVLKVEPLQIIGMLAWQLHVLALIKTAGDRPVESIARESKINPYVVRKSAGVARKLTFARIKELISELLVIDSRLKSESLNADDVVINYLINFYK